MIKIQLTAEVSVIPTSAHSCRFSNGVSFDPSEEDKAQIKSDWGCLTVPREFIKVVPALPGIGAGKSVTLPIPQAALEALDKAQAENPDALILVPFMLASALTQQGHAERYPRVYAANATKETARVSDVTEKVWDIDNFSAL